MRVTQHVSPNVCQPNVCHPMRVIQKNSFQKTAENFFILEILITVWITARRFWGYMPNWRAANFCLIIIIIIIQFLSPSMCHPMRFTQCGSPNARHPACVTQCALKCHTILLNINKVQCVYSCLYSDEWIRIPTVNSVYIIMNVIISVTMNLNYVGWNTVW